MSDLHALANAISDKSPAIKKFCLAVADILQPVAPPAPAPSTLIVGSNAYPGEENAALAFSTWSRWDRGTPPVGAKVCGLVALDPTNPLAMSPIVEVDNEPYFQGVNEEQWAVKARDCAKAIRAQNPTAKILLPLEVQVNNGDYYENGTWSPWVSRLWAAVPDLHTYFDGYAIHPYLGAGGDAFSTSHPTLQCVDHVRAELNAIPGADKPFYVTEMGWDCNKVSEADQSTYTGQMLAWLKARADVAAVFIFALYDNHDGNYGLLRADNSQKPVYLTAKAYV